VVIRIVIIEDNPADLRLFKEALRFFEIEAEVTHFPDGVTAVATMQSQQAPWNPPPDLVFLDLNMPRVSGFDVLTCFGVRQRMQKLQLRSLPHLKRPLILTALKSCERAASSKNRRRCVTSLM
jgi:CheY-like chemotaxis protein